MKRLVALRKFFTSDCPSHPGGPKCKGAPVTVGELKEVKNDFTVEDGKYACECLGEEFEE